jgi:hypothetical protein
MLWAAGSFAAQPAKQNNVSQKVGINLDIWIGTVIPSTCYFL